MQKPLQSKEMNSHYCKEMKLHHHSYYTASKLFDCCRGDLWMDKQLGYLTHTMVVKICLTMNHVHYYVHVHSDSVMKLIGEITILV